MCQTYTSLNTVFHRVGISHRQPEAVKAVVELGVVGSEIYYCRAFLLDEWCYCGIVVPLVLASHDEHGRAFHGLQCHTACVDVGRLGVIDIEDTVFLCHSLKSVLHTGECPETLSDELLVHSRLSCGIVCGESIALVVLSHL